MKHALHTQPENKMDKKKKITIGVVAAIIIVLLGIVGVLLFSNPYDKNASSIQNASGSYEDIVNELNEETEKSRLWISIANTMTVDSATNTCTAKDSSGQAISVLDNISKNTKDIKYTFLTEDGTVIYESELIPIGHSIQSPVLSKHLDPGTYNITVQAQGYDVESHNAVGGLVSAQIVMTVK